MLSALRKTTGIRFAVVWKSNDWFLYYVDKNRIELVFNQRRLALVEKVVWIAF
jgi:hypothetical protein